MTVVSGAPGKNEKAAGAADGALRDLTHNFGAAFESQRKHNEKLIDIVATRQDKIVELVREQGAETREVLDAGHMAKTDALLDLAEAESDLALKTMEMENQTVFREILQMAGPAMPAVALSVAELIKSAAGWVAEKAKSEAKKNSEEAAEAEETKEAEDAKVVLDAEFTATDLKKKAKKALKTKRDKEAADDAEKAS